MNDDPTSVECPTCHAWVGWACNGNNYGYHAAGYHQSRVRAARKLGNTLGNTLKSSSQDEP